MYLKQHLFLMVLEAGTSKTKVPADPVSGENGSIPGASPGQSNCTFPLSDACSMCVAPHVNLITSQRPHFQILSHWGLGVDTNFRGTQIFSPHHNRTRIWGLAGHLRNSVYHRSSDISSMFSLFTVSLKGTNMFCYLPSFSC